MSEESLSRNADFAITTYCEDDGYCPICYEPFMTEIDSRKQDREIGLIASDATKSDNEDSKSTHSGCTSCMGTADTRDSDGIDDHDSASTKEVGGDIELQQGQCNEVCRIQIGECYNGDQRRFSLEKVTIRGCGHSFCRACLHQHCSYAVSVREIPIRCPICPHLLPIDVVKQSLLFRADESLPNDSDLHCCPVMANSGDDAEISSSTISSDNYAWMKFKRFHRMWKDPSLIPCTQCDELIKLDSREHSDKIECPSCHHIFSPIYGDVRANMDSLSRVARRVHEQNERKTKRAIQNNCKPCSHCLAPIHKEAGCNHVICPVCHDDMCFRCGTHIYLTGDEVRKCSNCNGSYHDHRYLLKARMNAFLSCLLMSPIHLIYMATTLSLSLLSCGFLCCLGCGVHVKKRETNRSNGFCKLRLFFKPYAAIRKVCRFVFLPFVDLFQASGIRFWLFDPEPMAWSPSDDSDKSNTSDRSMLESDSFDEESQEKMALGTHKTVFETEDEDGVVETI